MKLLTHERDTIGDFGRRALMHIPHGLLIGIPILGYPLLMLFRDYQKNEDHYTHDEAWKDLYGAMIGAAISSGVVLIIILYLIWRLL